MTTGDGGRGLQTVETAFEILETLLELDGARVTELADELDAAQSTVHGYLKTMFDRGYVVKDGDVYHVGLRFLDLGGHARQRKRGYRLAGEKVNELASETEERVQFIVEEHGRGVYVHTGTGNQAVQMNARIGKMNYLHASAAGKAILAFESREAVEAMIDRWGLPEITENTITDRDELFEELETIRSRGYSVNKQESTVGLRSVGVPIRTESDGVLGALSLSGPSNRLRGEPFEETIPALLSGAANELELKIEYE